MSFRHECRTQDPSKGFLVAYSLQGEISRNEYIDRCASILARNCRVIQAPRSRDIIRAIASGEFQRLDVAVSNWEDNWIASYQTGRLWLRGILNFVGRLIILRLASKQVIYVRHNRFPHHTRASHAITAKMILNIVERLATCVVVHSPVEANSSRRHYVPHPLFFEPTHRTTDGHNEREYFVVFGRLLPYKGLEDLIIAFPPEKRLIIAGPSEPAYLARLLELAGDHSNIEIREGHLSQMEAASLVSNSEAMVIASAGAEMIVSGSYFFALSCATPVIAIDNLFFRWSSEIADAPGLTRCKDISHLAREIAVFSHSDRRLIADYARQYFCDSVVGDTWMKIFESNR